ncbi:hypothetical protein FB446DRAFT_750171 [Lentinula raphanica]|nr:hypothetical protein FB446DRAFT_750171 [Lentinula raphanica]
MLELDARSMKDPLLISESTPADARLCSNEVFVCSEGSLFTFRYKEQDRTVRLGRVLFRPQHGTAGKNMMIIRVKCACLDCHGEHSNCDWQGKKLVLKIGLSGENRVSEYNFLDRCRKIAIGEHEWVLNHLPEIHCSFDIPFREYRSRIDTKKRFQRGFEMRVMRGSIQEELEPLSSLTTARECAQVFYDVIQCHHWLWKYPRILHRNISQGNIMVREKDGKKYGVLNDWDLAIWLSNTGCGRPSELRTGRAPYMAHEQQSGYWKGPHRYRHDLESVFYVILLLTRLYSSPNQRNPTPPRAPYFYEKWHLKDDAFLRILGPIKRTILSQGDWEPSVTPFFSGFTIWLDQLHQALRRGLAQFDDHKASKKEAKDAGRGFVKFQEFDEETLGGYVSYEVFVWTMHSFEDEELETYGREWQGILLDRHLQDTPTR